MAAPSGPKGDYFRLPGAVSLVLVPIGILLSTVAYLSPQYVPYGYLGPVGRLVHYLVTEKPHILAGIFYMLWILHVIEAFYARYLARQKNLNEETAKKWAIATFFYGVFSLKHLMAYKPKAKGA